MSDIVDLNPQRVFYYFEKISRIPRGSGNREMISKFCEDFAKDHLLRFYRDNANNVIIYKDASVGYENSAPVILQGHLDMVCQKTADSDIDFEKDSLELYVDGDFLKAKGTTLGADDGIAVAMMLAILEDKSISHPPIEAVFTVDEEIGMLGAMDLDFSKLSGKKMINIDSEEENILTVSCAGGSDFKITVPYEKTKVCGELFKVTISGLKGGHSGVMIYAGRVNADILAGRILNYLTNNFNISLIRVNGGDKGNAIPLFCEFEFVCNDSEEVYEKLKQYTDKVIKEIISREPDVSVDILKGVSAEYECVDKESFNKLVTSLVVLPNGVMEMSASIDNLVETSLNLGILETGDKSIVMHYTLRSNIMSALDYLEARLLKFTQYLGIESESFGRYPAWEYCHNSIVQKLYEEIYRRHTGKEIKVCAIHAGLECGVFASHISGFDCISIGPDIHSIHTTEEKLSISSTKRIYEIVLDFLKESK